MSVSSARAPGIPFDFDRHRQEAVDQYARVRDVYASFADAVRAILRSAIPDACPIHSIQARAKSPESFGDKAVRALDSDPTQPQYPRPLVQITDLAGVRVITYFPRTLADIDRYIADEFEILEKQDKADELFAEGRFGYQSVHYLVKLKAPRTEITEYRRFRDLIAEIQVRTILQHAWAEMEHDISYKSITAIPSSIRRRFVALAGLVEIADREFQAIQDEDQSLRHGVAQSVEGAVTENPDLRPDLEVVVGRIKEARDVLTVAGSYIPGSARALTAAGLYEEAVRAYNEVVRRHPQVHTSYIGRARARFLAGDRPGALEDLETARRMCPDDPAIERLQLQVEGIITPAERTMLASSDLCFQGNRNLALGDPEAAYGTCQ